MIRQTSGEDLFVSIGLYMLRDQAVCAVPDMRTRAGSDLLRLALAHHFTSDPADWRLGRADTGARMVIDGSLVSPSLSLAHTGDLLVAAVADSDGDGGSIGVDVERLRQRRYASIARYLGWPPSLWAQPGAPTQDEFLHLWTLWEALLKSMPHAALADVRSVFATLAEQLCAGVVGVVHGKAWSGQSWQCPGRYWLSAVAHSVQTPSIRLFRVDRLAGDVESAQIQTITAPEGKIHF